MGGSQTETQHLLCVGNLDRNPLGYETFGDVDGM